MKSKAQKNVDEFYDNLEKQKCDKRFLERLETDMLRAIPAMKHLHKVTGKMGIDRIHPLEEKRWSSACMEHWKLLIGISDMINFGKLPEETVEDFLRNYKPLDAEYVGKFKTGSFPTKNKGDYR